jgi:hypothetical protein
MGQLGEFHLHNIVALLQVERQTGELIVEGGDSQRASFYVQEGQIIHALCGEATGFEAAVEPFGWATGKFHFEAYTPEVEPTITESNTAIVQAGRKRASEAAEVQTRVPTTHLILKLVPHANSNTGFINLAPEEWRFLTLVDGRRDLATLSTMLGCNAYTVRAIANRLLKNGLVEKVDLRRTMIRLVAQPIDTQERPPADAMTVLMDDLALDMLLKGKHLRRIPLLVLTPNDRLETLHVEGRPDLADRLLLSEAAMARLQVKRHDYIYIRLLDEEAGPAPTAAGRGTAS